MRHDAEKISCYIELGVTLDQVIAIANQQADLFLQHITEYYEKLTPPQKIVQIRKLLGDIEALKIHHATNHCSALLEALAERIYEALQKDSTINLNQLNLNELPQPQIGKLETFSAQFPDLYRAINDYETQLAAQHVSSFNAPSV